MAVTENCLQNFNVDPLEEVSLVILLGYHGLATFMLNAAIFIRSAHIHGVNPQAIGECVVGYHICTFQSLRKTVMRLLEIVVLFGTLWKISDGPLNIHSSRNFQIPTICERICSFASP